MTFRGHVGIGILVAVLAAPGAMAEAYPAEGCLKAAGAYMFEGDLGATFASGACAVSARDDEASKLVGLVLKSYGEGTFRLPENRDSCNAAWEFLVADLGATQRHNCDEAAAGADPREAELTRRCNVDQDVIMSLLGEDYNLPVTEPKLLACPAFRDVGIVADVIVRQENVAFLQKHGMPDRLDGWWMETPERVRALYLIVLHADNDLPFQKAMLAQFTPYAGKALKRGFYDNLARRIAMAEQMPRE